MHILYISIYLVSLFIIYIAPKIPDQSQVCPAEQDSVWRIQWPAAASGSTQFVRCPGGNSTKGTLIQMWYSKTFLM